MKDVFITIYTLFYLVSGIGFTEVQHYCQTMDKMMPGSENSCCCAASAACSIPNEPATPSCCGSSATTAPDKSIEMTFHGDCCDVQHNYNQLDSSSLPISIDANQAAKESIEELCHPEREQHFHALALQTLTDPSTHLNLPLLI